MCGNDDLASKVVHALKEKETGRRYYGSGAGCRPGSVPAHRRGTQVMTVYKPVEKMSQKAAECAVLLAKESRCRKEIR